MFRIVSRRVLARGVHRFEVEAPLVDASAKAGNFVIVRTSVTGERIPLTFKWRPDGGATHRARYR